MSAWTSRFGGREWREEGGVLLSRDSFTGVRSDPHGTFGQPVTIRRYLDAWGDEIRAASAATGVPVQLLLATLATENGPARNGPEKGLGFAQPRYRGESGGRLSVGPCHVLIGTARATMGDDSIDREWLTDLGNNLLAAASHIRDGEPKTGWDPILVAARYNSGGLYDASSPASRYHSRWHLRAHGDHLDRFANWYGDALAVLEELGEGASERTELPTEVSISGEEFVVLRRVLERMVG